MAVGTSGKLESGHRPTLNMTLVAGDLQVLPFEWIASLAMVEFGGVGHHPAFGSVTALAYVAELALVHVVTGVTVETLCVRDVLVLEV